MRPLPGPIAASPNNGFQEPASLEKIQVTAQDEDADRSVANGLDRQGVRIHRVSIGSRGLDDTNELSC